MLLEVLIANTKGVNPLELGCWGEENMASKTPLLGTSTSHGTEQYPFNFRIPDSSKRACLRFYDSRDGQGGKGFGRATQERHTLLGEESPAALNGIVELKQWQKRYSGHLKQGEKMFTMNLFQQAVVSPIAALWRFFEMR